MSKVKTEEEWVDVIGQATLDILKNLKETDEPHSPMELTAMVSVIAAILARLLSKMGAVGEIRYHLK